METILILDGHKACSAIERLVESTDNIQQRTGHLVFRLDRF